VRTSSWTNVVRTSKKTGKGVRGKKKRAALRPDEDATAKDFDSRFRIGGGKEKSGRKHEQNRNGRNEGSSRDPGWRRESWRKGFYPSGRVGQGSGCFRFHGILLLRRTNTRCTGHIRSGRNRREREGTLETSSGSSQLRACFATDPAGFQIAPLFGLDLAGTRGDLSPGCESQVEVDCRQPPPDGRMVGRIPLGGEIDRMGVSVQAAVEGKGRESLEPAAGPQGADDGGIDGTFDGDGGRGDEREPRWRGYGICPQRRRNLTQLTMADALFAGARAHWSIDRLQRPMSPCRREWRAYRPPCTRHIGGLS
jgi:hypothetical protein